jgi:DNA-binding PadR family transcriptional regulator
MAAGMFVGLRAQYDPDDWKMPRRRRQRNQEDQPRRLDGKAPIKAAALAVLLEAPGHGYDVATRINKRMGTWAINPKHIYRPLGQLEAAGLVLSRKEDIDEPPGSRRVYYPTEAAQKERQWWFGSRPAPSVVRVDIHARIAFSTEEDAPDLLRALDEYKADLLEEIQENAITWAAPRGSWQAFALEHLREEVDKQCKAEIEWVNDMSAALRERIAGRS